MDGLIFKKNNQFYKPTPEGYMIITGTEKADLYKRYVFLKQIKSIYIMKPISDIEEKELQQRQFSRYGCAFYTNGEKTVQVAREAGHHYPQIENLKSCGFHIDQTKR